MARSVNLDNGGERFNIDLDQQGNLNFNANNTDGNGDRRMSLADDSGTLDVGGGGRFGALQLRSSTGGNTIFVGVDEPTNQARAFLGGGNSSLNGRVLLGSASGQSTIDLNGSTGNVVLGSSTAEPGQDGDLTIRNNSGNTTITLTGSNGSVRCVDLTETSDARLKDDVTPLSDALGKVTALRGVRYRLRGTEPSGSEAGEGTRIGFIGQEVGSVYPELVSTDVEGYVSLNYSRLSAVLVEAIKEQQQLIRQQASALAEALQRIARIEATLQPRTT